jgi:hypothetical protein
MASSDTSGVDFASHPKGPVAPRRVGHDQEYDAGFPEDAAANATADALLDVLGYQAELVRTRSTWQVAFMSFVLASIPYGLSTTFYYPLVGGGPANIIWGWVGVTAIILCVAVSLGEITSIYPTAGGVYYQAFMLSPPWCRRITAWVTGWSYVLGNVTITLAVNFGTTLFIYGCLNIFSDSDGNPIFPGEAYQLFLLFLAITLLCNAISVFGNKWLPILDVRDYFSPVATHFSLRPMRRTSCPRDRPFSSPCDSPRCSPMFSLARVISPDAPGTRSVDQCV